MVEILSRAQRRQRDRQERRLHILAAARVVFDARGIAATTMDDVAAAAGLSKGTIYLYFKSKDELFMALASEVIERVLSAFRGLAGQPAATGRAHYRELIEAWLGIALESPNTIRNAFMWLASGDEVDTTTHGFREYKDRVERVHEYMSAAVERGQADGSIKSTSSPKTLVFRVWGCLMGALMVRINARELLRRVPKAACEEGSLSEVVDLLFDGLSGEAVR